MANSGPGPEVRDALREMLGYMNLSSGAPDAAFQRCLSFVFGWLEQRSGQFGPPWQALGRLLRESLGEAQGGGSAVFSDASQARAVMELAFERVPGAYRAFHRDLLFHRTDAELYRPFFLARVVEAVLQEGSPYDEGERIVEGAIRRLNDFVGHRPAAVLHNGRRTEPYPHEWVRPVPLYLREAGVESGPYRELIEQTLDLLKNTPEELLETAYFDPDLLDELAVDPRAYDFDHPSNKRINYQFGQWDPHHIDNQGRYRRYVVTHVTFNSLWRRVMTEKELPAEEVLFEAAAVLSGTMLMATAVSGRGPDSHDSTTTLLTLLPRIAGLRDDFYRQLLSRMKGRHGKRLREEASKRQQPFAAARQHLNQQLSRLRAAQQQHVFLADLYAQMGFPEASRRQVSVVPVVSARMLCEIHCRLTTGRLDVDRGDLNAALRQLRESEDLLHRGIECGGLIDPWNILGFGGQFSLFPALENSVRDHRADQLIRVMERLFALYAHLQSESAAVGAAALRDGVADGMDKLAGWWDQFATSEVSDVPGFSGREAAESAQHVARAVGAWHQGGAAAGDIAFWRSHVGSFTSPRAYALVVAALLEKGDHQSSMALLMQWLSQVEQVPLEGGEHSFHRLALRWMNTVRVCREYSAEQRWSLLRRFFDYLEANAEEYWTPPHFQFAAPEEDGSASDDDPADDDDDPFAAAYEGMTYQDTTDDGFEGDVFDEGPASDDELEEEAKSINRHLAFLSAVAEMWEVAALSLTADLEQLSSAPMEAGGVDCQETLSAWLAAADANGLGLRRLLAEVHGYEIPVPSGSQDSMLEFDRRQGIKEMILEAVINTTVSTSVAARALCAASRDEAAGADLPKWERQALLVRRAIDAGNVKAARRNVTKLLKTLRVEPLLYVPLQRGGDPRKIVAARIRQQFITELAKSLPRLGLLREACRTLETAWEMETYHPVGPGAVSEFDRLFTQAYQSLVEGLVISANHWTAPTAGGRGRQLDAELIDCLNLLTEKVLQLWLRHSSGLRLSVLEGVNDSRWRNMVKFIKQYGHDLFTPAFLNEGNLRAIMHQGAAAYLRRLKRNDSSDIELDLLDDLDGSISAEDAGEILELVIQAILENDQEYNDYNHTTTQSDRGELIYCLLDFLRVKVGYERMAWNLTPVQLAHEILVRHRRVESAEIWRRGVAEQTSEAADDLWERYSQLVNKYGMRLPTVADRLQERFVQPLEIDCIRALIKPALDELRDGGPTRTFDRLEQEVSDFGQSPLGVGLDLPQWLLTLEEELEDLQAEDQPELSHRNRDHLSWRTLDPGEIQRQLESWDAG